MILDGAYLDGASIMTWSIGAGEAVGAVILLSLIYGSGSASQVIEMVGQE